ncbi:MAG: hypothetical protein LBC17_01185, partial [Lactobacillaceae bacterium]|nr:hypothetical protein [Lactobacillaceae bacterium]
IKLSMTQKSGLSQKKICHFTNSVKLCIIIKIVLCDDESILVTLKPLKITMQIVKNTVINNEYTI